MIFHKKNHNSDYFIPYDNFVNGCFVLCVNTQNEQSAFNNINIDRKGNLNISLLFSAPIPNSLLIHTVGSIDSTFDLDNDKIISTNYQY